jgi:glycerate 2-kinase
LVTLIVSDVVGNDIGVIASGPSAFDETTLANVGEIVERYQLHKSVAQCDSVEQFMRDFQFKETPKRRETFARVDNVLLLSNDVALRAMARRAGALGYEVTSDGACVTGEARALGRRYVARLRPGMALLGAGETTVTVVGSGRGGRNQELALGAALVGDNNNNDDDDDDADVWPCDGVVASLGTDGADNGPLAGALVDEQSGALARARSLNAAQLLANNDAQTLFEAMPECCLRTGHTGTNVADLMLALGCKRDRSQL